MFVYSFSLPFFLPSINIDCVPTMCQPWRREWQPTPLFLPGESHGLAGYSPWVAKIQI